MRNPVSYCKLFMEGRRVIRMIRKLIYEPGEVLDFGTEFTEISDLNVDFSFMKANMPEEMKRAYVYDFCRVLCCV